MGDTECERDINRVDVSGLEKDGGRGGAEEEGSGGSEDATGKGVGRG